MNAPYKIALIQMRCSNDAKDNLARATDMLKQAAKKGAKLACLPELFLGYYFGQEENHANFDLAEAVPGPTTEALSKVAKETGMGICGSVYERAAAGVYYNTSFVVDADGAYLGKYRKMHIPDDPLYYEKFYFAPGDLGFKNFDVKGAGRVGTLICWDQWYPEAARLTAMQGADVLFYPTAIGWHPKEKAEYGETHVSAWQTVQRGHAVANGVYVAATNRIGSEVIVGDGIEFFGHSFIADPSGNIIAQASRDKEEILMAEIDPARVETTRRHWPFFRDRRIDAYGDVTKRWTE